MNFTSIGEQVVAGAIVLLLSILITYLLNRNWTKRNIISLLKSDKALQTYIESLSSALNDKKILVLQEPGDNDLRTLLTEIPAFKSLEIGVGNHWNTERVSAYDLTIVSTSVLRNADNRSTTFEDIIRNKGPQQALIFFAPRNSKDNELDLTEDEFRTASSRSFITVTRAPGRLANDALSLLSFLP